MKNVKVVIGANYGDEGKGTTVNRISNGGAVVRFNGGAQAGHTVMHNGKRHVYHSFGSATLNGAATIYGPEFAIDPIMFFREADQLHNIFGNKLLNLEVYADPSCPIVTPFDIIINQALEKKRGNSRHGSCGMGFGETIKRNAEGFSLKIGDDDIINKCNDIKSDYFLPKVKDLDLDISDYNVDLFMSLFLREIEEYLCHVTVIDFRLVEKEFDDIVFEGAQGLCLDQNSEDFPHVTYSNTGLDNVVNILNKNEHRLDVRYITRSYLTRHGAGPLKNEKEMPDFVVDETNRPNRYQGSLRFADLNFERMEKEITKDLDKAAGFNISKKLVVTCCDQYDESLSDIEEFADRLGLDLETSWGGDGRLKIN